MSLSAAQNAQSRAADPGLSTWVAANAGSGKTTVLIDRVARLLLGGVDPASVLCLTYTKAAAGEMQNRLFKRLGAWAMLEDAALLKDLTALQAESGAPAPLAKDLPRARRLFAQAIETPGGLRIQTIHSFCAALLRRFPLEAGVPPRFRELDSAESAALRRAVFDQIGAGPEAPLLAALADFASETDLPALADTFCAEAARFAAPFDSAAALKTLGGLPPEALQAQAFTGAESAFLPALLAALARSAAITDRKLAATLAPLAKGPLGLQHLPLLEDALLTGKAAKAPFTAKIGTLPTKALRTELPPALLTAFEDLMTRVEAARPARLGLLCAQRSATVHTLARAFLARYSAEKAARGVLDFDDLIARAHALLAAPGLGAWVRYRLDGGIAHILVDEAQDTSPAQWRTILLLAEEILAGAGSGPAHRTLFIVGDPKQSIYSFQGADVAEFDRTRAALSAQLSAPERPLAEVALDYSFRSSPLLLNLVDAALAPVKTALGGRLLHQAVRGQMPGRVELWPRFEAAPLPEDTALWEAPVDQTPPDHPARRLAQFLAARLAQLFAEGAEVPDPSGGFRRLTPGDVLILVRRRSTIFHEIIRALKRQGLPVAGADRLRLGGELAVKDLTALLNFLALPEDDLSLAAALRSPLFGLSEDALFRLAYGRRTSLWDALRAKADLWPETHRILSDLRDHADFLRPYELMERLLTQHQGRARLMARLGREAEEGVETLVEQALLYESHHLPSLTGFLAWLSGAEVEVKRQQESGGGLIRVMSVHGAKGLEAPLVILPDTALRQGAKPPRLLAKEGRLFWNGGAGERPPALAEAEAARKAAESDEDARLLYVAMTRAQSWLMLGEASPKAAGAEDEGEAPQSWYGRVEAGLQQLGAAPWNAEGAEGAGLLLQSPDWPAAQAASPPPPAPESVLETAPLPAALLTPAAPEDGPAPPLSPSALPGAKTLGGGEGEGEDARRRGVELHLLLEHLPRHAPALWPGLARTLIPEPARAAERLALAEGLLRDPALAPFFGPESLAEVTLTAPFAEGVLLGTIDRLWVTPERVFALDFKTNAEVPARAEDIPPGLRAQMEAYGAALAQIYPGRPQTLALLWTATGKLMELTPKAI